MNILVVTQYFAPENFKINDMVLALHKKGHHIHVLTGLPNYPDGKIYSGYGFFKKINDEYHGIKITRSWLIPRGNSSGARLFINYISFMILCSITGLLRVRGKFDVIFVHEPSPIFVGIPALVMKWLKKAPICFWVLDLWPESMTAAGNINSPLILHPVRKIVRFIYNNTETILVSSKGFIKSICSMQVEPEKIDYFPNWAEEHFLPLEKKAILEASKIPAGFKVMFAGNIGEAQDIPTIINAAEKVKKSTTDVKWIFVGKGRKLEWAAQEVKLRKLEDVIIFLGAFPIEKMSEFFSHADAMLISLKDEPIFSLTVPSKLQPCMACGKPLLTMLNGEGSRINDEAKSGLSCPAGDADQLAENVLKMYNMPAAELNEMGQSALSYYKDNFDRNMLMDKLENILFATIQKSQK